MIDVEEKRRELLERCRELVEAVEEVEADLACLERLPRLFPETFSSDGSAIERDEGSVSAIEAKIDQE